MLVRHGEKGWIDNAYVTESLDSGRLIRVMVRSHKVPEVGDKFSSRHGQKGVIGRLVDEKGYAIHKGWNHTRPHHQSTRHSKPNDCRSRSRNDRW